MLRIGIRDYVVRLNPLLYNDFIQIYDTDDNIISDEETAKSFINQTVACFRFRDNGFMYEKYLATLINIKKIRDSNFDLDSWEIEVSIIPHSVMYYDDKKSIINPYEKYVVNHF